MIRYFVNCFLCLLPPSRFFRLRRVLLRIGGVKLERGVSFCGHGWIYGRGDLNIGANTWLSSGVIVYTNVEASICIGRDCDIGPSVKLVTGTHWIAGSERRAGRGLAQDISIGDGSWVGAGSLILGGVKIGDGCVVAAGTVVTKDVPSNSLIAGVPGQVKRQLS